MKFYKLLILYSVVLIFSKNILAQAQIDIPFIVSDGNEFFDWLRVGLDTTATNCIDPQLGEFEIPPIPPTGLFDCRFNLTPYGCGPITTYKDYRPPGNPPSFPFTGQVEHTLIWQLGSSGSFLTIFYDFPAGAFANIKDPFGGIIYNTMLSDSGSYTIPLSNALTEAILTMNYINIGGEPVQGPVFSMLPSNLNFGEVAYGESEILPVFITNAGYLDSLYIYNTISSNSSFTIEPNIFPLILRPSQTQIFNITYTGITGGTHIDSILFIHNAQGSPSRLNVRAETYEPNPNCEAQILCEIIISDGVDPTPRILNFGLDSTGTEGIDPQLGEHGPLPPFPPPGVFEAQFFLPENNFSGSLSAYCDFRGASFPFSGQVEWRLAYQTAFGNQISIDWDFPSYLTGVLQDIINGTFINIPMVGSGSYIVQDPYIFNRLRMIIDFNIETPVELTSFNATFVDHNVRLDWKSVTETNNSGFEIRRFTQNDNEWEKIGFVPGFGTTTEPKSYSFTDVDVTTGNYKYRLKQIDFDGSFTYSNEIEVEVNFTPKEFVLYQNYPNPFNPNTVIRFEIPGQARNDNVFVTLKIYDILGNEVATLVNEERHPGVYEVEFNASNLSSGIYFYQLKADNYSQIKKMVLLR
jgi:hypothetical protein